MDPVERTQFCVIPFTVVVFVCGVALLIVAHVPVAGDGLPVELDEVPPSQVVALSNEQYVLPQQSLFFVQDPPADAVHATQELFNNLYPLAHAVQAQLSPYDAQFVTVGQVQSA